MDSLKLIYVNDLRKIVSLTVRGLNERRPDPIKAHTVLVLSAQGYGLVYCYTGGLSELLYRAGTQFLASAGRSVRLRVNSNKLVLTINKSA